MTIKERDIDVLDDLNSPELVDVNSEGILLEEIDTQYGDIKETYRELISPEELDELLYLCSRLGIEDNAQLDEFLMDNHTNESGILDVLRAKVEEGVNVEESAYINRLKEQLEESEDVVECSCCEELAPKDHCVYHEGQGYVCDKCSTSGELKDGGMFINLDDIELDYEYPDDYDWDDESLLGDEY